CCSASSLAKILMVIAFGAVGLAAAVTSSMGVCSLSAQCAVAGQATHYTYLLPSAAQQTFLLPSASAAITEILFLILLPMCCPAGFSGQQLH
ncbi:MAG: hypothetical protein WCE72_04435, partial [Pseudolabrys sp.]